MCYYATAIFGLLAYLYLFVNHVNNNDMISCLPYGYGSGLSSGRWMLQILNMLADKLWGSYPIPVFNGLLSLVFLGLTGAVLVRVLELKGKWQAFALGAITATAAPIGSIFFFLFATHFYMLALLCMTVAAWLLKKRSVWGFILSVVLAACSLGIYQAYFPFFAVILLLELLHSCLTEEKSCKELLLRGVKFAAALVASYVLYYLILQGFLLVFSRQLSDYQGLDAMGSISLKALPLTYYHFFALFTHNYVGFNATLLLRIVLLLLLAVSLWGLLCFWLRAKKKVYALLATVIFLLLPLAANAFLILAPQSIVYTRMTMGLMSLFYLPLILVRPLPKKLRVSGAVCLLLLLCAVNYAWQSNGNYMWVAYSNEKAANYFTTMFTRIKSTEGYDENMEVVFVGAEIDDGSFQDNWYGTPFLYGGRTGAISQLNQYSRPSFILSYLGYSYRDISPQELESYQEVIEEMEAYPNDDSIVVVDGKVLVKLEEP
ncbi:MAG: glucosyltransferase domain-containing protein [Oscillospiraceae bacterium]|nr:glucosyltransferase domain-containing protein [Oscillospiraceae bacterium]